MASELLTKENLAIVGVVILFIWRVTDSLIKLYKKEASATDKMAFDMAKTKLSNNRTSYDFPLMTYFFMYRWILKKKLRFPQEYADWLSNKEESLDMKMQQLEFRIRESNTTGSNKTFVPTWRSVLWDVKFLLRKVFEKDKTITKRVFVQNKYGERLAGLRDLPVARKRQKYPTVILVHGFGAEKTENGMFNDIAKGLATNNYQVFRFDFAGLGESEGNYQATTLTRQAEDLEYILNYVKTNPATDTYRMGLLGMSLGTAVITALHPQGIKAFVYLGSASEPHKTLKGLFGDGYNPDSVSTRITSEGKTVKVWGEFWKDFDRYDLPALIKDIRAPILFIHGEKDSKVGVNNAETYLNNANPPKELRVIKNADHGFYEAGEREEMLNLAVGWFNKYLL